MGAAVLSVMLAGGCGDDGKRATEAVPTTTTSTLPPTATTTPADAVATTEFHGGGIDDFKFQQAPAVEVVAALTERLGAPSSDVTQPDACVDETKSLRTVTWGGLTSFFRHGSAEEIVLVGWLVGLGEPIPAPIELPLAPDSDVQDALDAGWTRWEEFSSSKILVGPRTGEQAVYEGPFEPAAPITHLGGGDSTIGGC